MATTEKKSTAKKPQRKPRPRPTNGLSFNVWTENGAPLPTAAVEAFEAAIQKVQFELFNDGVRVLTSTAKA